MPPPDDLSFIVYGGREAPAPGVPGAGGALLVSLCARAAPSGRKGLGDPVPGRRHAFRV